MSLLDTVIKARRLTTLGYVLLYGGVGFAAWKFFNRPVAAAANPNAAANSVNGLGSSGTQSVAAPNGLTTGTLTLYGRNRFGQARPLKIGEFVDPRGAWTLTGVVDAGKSGQAQLVRSNGSGERRYIDFNIDNVRGLRVGKLQ